MKALTTEQVIKMKKVEPDTLIHGDCLEIMKYIPLESVDLIIADLPMPKYSGKVLGKWEEIIPLKMLWRRIKKVLKPEGVVVFTSIQPLTTKLISSNPRMFKYDLIWKKSVGSGQLNVSRQPLRYHENILIFYNRFNTYNEIKTKGKPYTVKRNLNHLKGTYGRQRSHRKVNKGTRRAKSIIEISNPRLDGGHPKEKPIELMENLVKTYSNPGDTVLDFVCGHGTTLAAARKLGRRSIGIEIDYDWFAKSKKRLSIPGKLDKRSKNYE